MYFDYMGTNLHGFMRSQLCEYLTMKKEAKTKSRSQIENVK